MKNGKYFIDLTKYVPAFINDIPEMAAIYHVEGLELGLLQEHIEDIFNQFNVKTATWGLAFYEDKYGITYNPNLSYEHRREAINAAKRSKGTCDTNRVKIIAESFSNGECEVTRHDNEGYFQVEFVGTLGIPKNMLALKKEIEKAKPAKLEVKYKFRYNLLRDLTKYTLRDFVDNNLTLRDLLSENLAELIPNK